MLTWIRLAALTLTALTMGLSFAHVLEMPAKLAYPPDLYVALQNSLYEYFGYIGAFVEPGAVLAVVILAYLVRRRRPAFRFTVGAVLCLLLAFPLVFLAFTQPANETFHAARPASVPADFEAYRNQWEFSHAVRFVLHLAGFAFLTLSVLVRPRAPRSELSPYTLGALPSVRERSYSAPSSR